MILVAGSANLDFVVRATRIPSPGETVMGRDFKTFAGGKGANQAVACARAGGADTAMVLAVGNDPFAAPIEASLSSAGVRLHIVHITDQPTGTAFICVSDGAENAITVAPGANTCLKGTHLPALNGISHLLMQLETPIETVTAYARIAQAQGVKVVLNAAPAQPLPSEFLSLIDVLLVNEAELARISDSDGAIAQMMKRLEVDCIVVTLGEKGCVARVNGKYLTQPGFSIDAIDSTAAGDTFCGVFVASISNNSGVEDALVQATAASALTCTRLGAQDSIPEQADVRDFLESRPLPNEEKHGLLRQYCGL